MTRWWVSLPYATFGIAAQDDRIVEAPPIARWTIGKPVSEVLAGATILKTAFEPSWSVRFERLVVAWKDQ